MIPVEQATQSAPAPILLSVVLHNYKRALKHLFWLPLLLGLLLGGVMGFRADRSYVPRYSATATFTVRARYAASLDLISTSSYLNASAAEQLAATFPYVRDSDATRLLLQQELGGSVNGVLTASSMAEASLFTMRATSSSAEDAFALLNAMITVYPQAASPVLGQTQIQILDQPSAPPTAPDNANPARSTALRMGVLGVLLGLALVLVLSMTRRTVHSEADLARVLNRKCLAYLPELRAKKRSGPTNRRMLLTNARLDEGFAESVRSLRVKVQKAMQSRSARVLLLTSTLPAEGKTTVAANLALSLAAEGKRVVLIDADLRKQRLKALLGVQGPSDGMLEVLTGKAENFRLLNVPDSSLLLISGDGVSVDPQRLLDAPRLKQLISLLREKFDYVLIDTPPAGLLSDAASLSRHADAVLYVVRQDLANTSQILNAVQSMDAAGADIIGCVLNGTQAGTTRSGYASKHSGYGYKYAYGYHNYGRKSRAAEEEID